MLAISSISWKLLNGAALPELETMAIFVSFRASWVLSARVLNVEVVEKASWPEASFNRAKYSKFGLRGPFEK
jgi:hypothetical protein